MLDRSELQQAWDRIHRGRPASERPAEEMEAFAGHLRQRLPPGAPLLDAGCGQGRHTLYLSQMGFTAYGCDLSPVVVEAARMRAQEAGATAEFQVADLTHLPYPDNLFAAVVCARVLPYHLKAAMTKGVRELRRVLQPDGWLYLDLLHCDDAEYGCGQELEKHTFLDPDGVPVHFSSRQEVNELLRGFALERMTRLELGSGLHPRVAWVIWGVKLEERQKWQNSEANL